MHLYGVLADQFVTARRIELEATADRARLIRTRRRRRLTIPRPNRSAST